MTLQEFIEKTKTDEALNEKMNIAIMEKVILPMAEAEGVELTDEELEAVNGGGIKEFFNKIGEAFKGGAAIVKALVQHELQK